MQNFCIRIKMAANDVIRNLKLKSIFLLFWKTNLALLENLSRGFLQMMPILVPKRLLLMFPNEFS